jgi:hypothetical protein
VARRHKQNRRNKRSPKSKTFLENLSSCRAHVAWEEQGRLAVVHTVDNQARVAFELIALKLGFWSRLMELEVSVDRIQQGVPVRQLELR